MQKCCIYLNDFCLFSAEQKNLPFSYIVIIQLLGGFQINDILFTWLHLKLNAKYECS